MQHSVKEIGKRYQAISDKREDKLRFNAQNFYIFALSNQKKYSIVPNGQDLLVSTWHSDDLIENYKKTLK
jgi:hypothetical protein